MKPFTRSWPNKGVKTVPLMWLLIALILAVFSSSQALAATAADDFNDNLKNSSKWGQDQVFGHGVLTERNHRLEYTCVSGTFEDDAIRPWVLTRFPYNANWEMQIDISNTTLLTADFQVNSFGIKILSPLSASSDIYAELYSSHLFGGPQRSGFRTDLVTDGIVVAFADTGELPVTNSALRMVFSVLSLNGPASASSQVPIAPSACAVISGVLLSKGSFVQPRQNVGMPPSRFCNPSSQVMPAETATAIADSGLWPGGTAQLV